MGKIKTLISDFREGKDSQTKEFIDNVLDKLIYPDGSIESDLRALARKSADLRKEASVSHSLVKDKKAYTKIMKTIVFQLTILQDFLEHIVAKMPDRVNQIIRTLETNKTYLGVHSSH